MNDFALIGESFRQDSARELTLRPYQIEAIERLREGFRAGHKRQLLCAPTGAGKTEIAMALVLEAEKKLSRTAFLVDRIVLCDQSSARYEGAGIQHGIVQAGHWRWRPQERHQICSVQTLQRRGMAPGTSLIIVDEAHVMYRMTVEFLKAHPDIYTVGLTATPFTKGLGQIFSNIVNVTTTDQLVADGYLVPLKCYAGKAADMTGAKTKFDGEWAEAEMESRGNVIVGDVVAEWIEKTTIHFGGPVKTIVFSATVAHGEELCHRFQEHGHNFQQISYKDGNDESRKRLIEEFRKPDSEIMGLTSCEVLVKGFDVSDVRCGISARPYRKSLSGHIQQLGRVMRPHPGKDFALWLDHSGNILRFHQDTAEIFSNGVVELDDGKRDAKVRKEPDEEERATFRCKGCGYIMAAAAPRCPSCGLERPKKPSMVQEVAGEMMEVTINGKTKHLPPWLEDKDAVARQLWHIALERKGGDAEAANKFALAQYQNLYHQWPRLAFRNVTPESPDPRLTGKVQSMVIAWAKRKRKETA